MIGYQFVARWRYDDIIRMNSQYLLNSISGTTFKLFGLNYCALPEISHPAPLGIFRV